MGRILEHSLAPSHQTWRKSLNQKHPISVLALSAAQHKMAILMKPGVEETVTIVDGDFEGDLFKVKSYPSYKDLCNPAIRPIFYTRVVNNTNAPSDWIILVVPGTPDLVFKADPRKNDMLRVWSIGKEFPDFLPVYQIKRIGRWNRLAKIAKGRVNIWIRNEFTFLQTEAR
jgi:hypothetical protein